MVVTDASCNGGVSRNTVQLTDKRASDLRKAPRAMRFPLEGRGLMVPRGRSGRRGSPMSPRLMWFSQIETMGVLFNSWWFNCFCFFKTTLILWNTFIFVSAYLTITLFVVPCIWRRINHLISYFRQDSANMSVIEKQSPRSCPWPSVTLECKPTSIYCKWLLGLGLIL